LVAILLNDCNLESSIPSSLGDICNLQHLDLQSKLPDRHDPSTALQTSASHLLGCLLQ
jgi:Leucine-rich repeat (LRR) protein